MDAARRSVKDIASLSEEYAALSEKLDELYYSAEDIAYTLRDAAEGVELDMERLDAVEQRLKQISDLRRKYGRTVEDVLAFLSDAEAKLNELINAEAFIAEIDAKLEKSRRNTTSRPISLAISGRKLPKG